MIAPSRLDTRLRLLIVAISVATVASGAFQVVAPGVVLRFIGVERTSVSTQLFATIGMFMVVVGGALLHALLTRSREPVLVLWAAIQKFLAAAAVVIGVGRGVFSALALLVASFDFCSGVLVAWYWRRGAP
jgi:hypothetical protein